MSANARHHKVTSRWGTSPEIVQLGRTVIGGAYHDTDPCTEAMFEPVVGALTSYSILDRGEDGLVLPWLGHVICNPPGGLVREFWRKAVAEVSAYRAASVYWVGFSVEQLCLLADEPVHPLDYSTCFLRKRIGFCRHDGKRGSPTHSNYCTFVTSVQSLAGRFAQTLAPHGRVQIPKE